MNENRTVSIVVVAGPNGAGKSTTAASLLQGALQVREFVNADTIARGLSAFAPEGAAISAGRVMLRRLSELAARRVSFAFETTLASRSFAPWLTRMRRGGYTVHVVFLWLPTAQAAVDRVAERVRMGGHDVPEAVIRRRYASGLRNFFRIYRPLADAWWFYDNSGLGGPRPVASGIGAHATVADLGRWAHVLSGAEHES